MLYVYIYIYMYIYLYINIYICICVCVCDGACVRLWVLLLMYEHLETMRNDIMRDLRKKEG